MGYEPRITERAKDYILEKGWDEQFGARPLKRAIQKYVEDMLAEEIILTKLVAGDIINIDFDPEIKDMKIVVEKPEVAPVLEEGSAPLQLTE
jgi:ATP-dependent Clp protease ATP-binding subunit ClpC